MLPTMMALPHSIVALVAIAATSAFALLIAQIMPLVAGATASSTFQFVKKLTGRFGDWVDGLPDLAKQFVVGGLTTLFAWIASQLPSLVIPADLHQFDFTLWNVIVSNAFAFGWHSVVLKNLAKAWAALKAGVVPGAAS